MPVSRRFGAASVESESAPVRSPPSIAAAGNCKPLPTWRFEHRQGGLTEKNLNVIRAVLTGRVWDQVVQLPLALMAEARLLRHQAPVKAAVTAQIATAIAILTFAPIRLGNLIQIKLGENLIKPGALDDPYWLVFPHYDVKNRVRLQFKLVPQLCAIRAHQAPSPQQRDQLRDTQCRAGKSSDHHGAYRFYKVLSLFR